jgi:hypothetical protein
MTHGTGTKGRRAPAKLPRQGRKRVHGRARLGRRVRRVQDHGDGREVADQPDEIDDAPLAESRDAGAIRGVAHPAALLELGREVVAEFESVMLVLRGRESA